MALELARRGRAQSVCALSPAGFWDEGLGRTRPACSSCCSTRPATPAAAGGMRRPLSRSRRFRRWALRDAAVHGDRRRREDLLDVADDTVGCDDRRGADRARPRMQPLDAPCPITIAWAAEDVLFPLDVYRRARRAAGPRRRVPRPRRRRPRADVSTTRGSSPTLFGRRWRGRSRRPRASLSSRGS